MARCSHSLAHLREGRNKRGMSVLADWQIHFLRPPESTGPPPVSRSAPQLKGVAHTVMEGAEDGGVWGKGDN